MNMHFPRDLYVTIEAGSVTVSERPELIGKTVYTVSLVDTRGASTTDYIGMDRREADLSASFLARDYGVRILDLTKEKAND